MDLLLGEIRLRPYHWVPMDRAPCQGQVLDIRENTNLYVKGIDPRRN